MGHILISIGKKIGKFLDWLIKLDVLDITETKIISVICLEALQVMPSIRELVSTEHLSAFVERVIAGVISFDIMKTVMIS